jgi:hypothetical protein
MASLRPSSVNDERFPLLAPESGPSNNSNVLLFRRAVGINSNIGPSDDTSLETGRSSATGLYAIAIKKKRSLKTTRIIISILLYTCHIAQLVIGAVLTAMGPSAGTHSLGITVLGATNTVVAGILALVKGQGLPGKIKRSEIEYRRLQDWIEGTEALIVIGVAGRTRDEVGALVEEAFRKWNAAKDRSDNSRPEDFQDDEGEASTGQGKTGKFLKWW